MAEKRYAIVRADKFCPRALERNYNLKCIGSLHCDKCDLKKNYGDTKEQMIKKVAQAIFRKINKFGDKWRNKIWTEADIRYSYKLAKLIVEFLGVE